VSAFGASPHGSGVCSGFWRGLGSEIRRLPESLPAIRTGGWYSYLSHLYQGLLREKIHQIPRNPCDYCDAVDFKTQFFHKRHRLVQCRHCGLECVERRPPGGQDVFSGYFEREEVVADVAREWQDPALSSVRIESMQQLFAQSGVTFPCPGKRVYELGCGQGQLLKALERERMNVAGMDGAGSLVNYARHTLHLTVDKLTLDQVVVPSHPYDFVLAFHVIEHLDAPSLLFKKAWELLCPGGFLFLETPILELNELPLRNKLDEKTGYANLEHMFFFTRKTLSPYFEKYGFILVGSYQFLSNGGFLGQKRDDAGYHPT
jgi:2-polyprenyl-3-methyl-5-hydroxy-6-metoxy-1,4-benzoquinol methylase